jgi:hypothetical protein
MAYSKTANGAEPDRKTDEFITRGAYRMPRRQLSTNRLIARTPPTMQRLKGLVLLSALVCARSLFAQPQGTGPCYTVKAQTIACLFVDIATSTLATGNASVASPDVPTGNAVLVTPLTLTQPTPSPASGFIYTFDPSTGILVRSSQSFGPILAERADTIGRNKLSVGFTFQRFVYDKLDGFNLHDLHTTIPLIVAASPTQLLPATASQTVNVDLQYNQNTIFATYGITDRVDASIAVPIPTVHLGIALNSNIVLTQSPGPAFPVFASGSHTASGLGDINLQVKGTVLSKESAKLAVGAVLRLPSGDEYEALGAGTTGIRPFIAGSISYKRISPHVNFGYQLNGQSILTGNIITGVKRQIPDLVQYAAGLDAGVSRWLTLDFDMLGTEVIHGDRFTSTPQIFIRKSYNITNGAAGFKLNFKGNLLLVGNLLFRLNDGGVRSKIAPLVGLTYAF